MDEIGVALEQVEDLLFDLRKSDDNDVRQLVDLIQDIVDVFRDDFPSEEE